MKVLFKHKLQYREKIILLIGGLLVLTIILYYLFLWYNNFKVSIREQLEVQKIYLERQLNKISEKEDIERRFKISENELKRLEEGLLSGNKPPLAAAELQRLLKDMALSLEIDITSEKTVNPVDMGLWLGIPVEIGFITSTAKLKDILLKIERSPLLLTISDIKARVRNIRDPEDVYTSLTVTGVIKKEVGEE